jgi:large subunit ribosomal protein L18
MDKKAARNRRSRQTRIRIAEQRATRLVVSRSNCHIYAQIIAPEGNRVLASASTLEADIRKDGKSGGNKAAAELVGARIAEKAKTLGAHWANAHGTTTFGFEKPAAR